jgi:hypothetical protein
MTLHGVDREIEESGGSEKSPENSVVASAPPNT